MPKLSAGILVYRMKDISLEFFLVHPGGPFWANKDSGSWSIPKGEYREGEDPLAAAKREFQEETGFDVPKGNYIRLMPLKQPSGKVVSAWAAEGDFDTGKLQSNTFKIEWPPKSGNEREFPEVDKAGWFDLKTAREKILSGQQGFLNELEKIVKESGSKV